MSTIALFHSAIGLDEGVHRLAEALRADGHTVHTPDLFEGRTFDTVAAGAAHRDAVGIATLMERAAAAMAELPNDVVYIGLSMGAATAQWLALTRPGARAVVLLHGAVPLAMLGVERWPADLPTQVHCASDDPFVERADVEALAQSAAVEAFFYPGDAHFFDMGPWRGQHVELATQMTARIRAFLLGR